MDPRKRLSEAQQAAAEGRHADALRGYEWFHRNALKHDRSFYGVRLSFALWYWTELGKVYPKAIRSLERIRRDKMAALRKGKGDSHLFHDVVSINEYLDRQADTYRLFRRLDTRRPAMAEACARLAMPAIVNSRDYKLARRYMPDPEGRLAWRAKVFNEDIEYSRRYSGKRRAMSRKADVDNYCQEVRLLTAVLRGTGERARAADIRRAAVGLVKSPSARKLVTSKLRP